MSIQGLRWTVDWDLKNQTVQPKTGHVTTLDYLEQPVKWQGRLPPNLPHFFDARVFEHRCVPERLAQLFRLEIPKCAGLEVLQDQDWEPHPQVYQYGMDPNPQAC